MLLSALARVLADWTGTDRVTVALEGHGREEELAEGTDLARTVGWFTTQYPVTPDPGRPRRLGCHAQGRQGTAAGRAPPRPELPGTGPPRLARPGRAGPRRTPAAPGVLHLPRSVGGARRRGLRARRRRTRPGHRPRRPAGPPPRRLPPWSPTASWSSPGTTATRCTGPTPSGGWPTAWCARSPPSPSTAPGPERAAVPPPDFPLRAWTRPAWTASPATAGTWRTCCRSPRSRRACSSHRLVGGPDDVYVDQAALLLEGVTDPDALAAAWQRVTDRTPALRTSVVWQDVPVPLQVVHRHVTVPVRQPDWREPGRGGAGRTAGAAARRRPRPRPGPRRGPLMRLL
ncbi:condensation domain-containing protein [Streptomyces tricolor]|nr:condensation domain-containing protein [Streptomyces tricolor]